MRRKNNIPKYKIGDTVSFNENGDILTGEIQVINDNGTFEHPGLICYDVLVKYKNMIYKHIIEKNLF